MLANRRVVSALFIGLLSILPFTSAFSAEKRSVAIGTGDVTGVYFPAGGAICRLINNGRKDHGIRCSVEPTSGSIQNINRIRSGDLEFGIVQSDWQYHAYKGTSKFGEGEPDGGANAEDNLRGYGTDSEEATDEDGDIVAEPLDADGVSNNVAEGDPSNSEEGDII